MGWHLLWRKNLSSFLLVLFSNKRVRPTFFKWTSLRRFLFLLVAFSVAVCAQGYSQARQRALTLLEPGSVAPSSEEKADAGKGKKRLVLDGAFKITEEDAFSDSANAGKEMEAVESADSVVHVEAADGTAADDAGSEIAAKDIKPVSQKRIPELTIAVPENNSLIEKFRKEFLTEEGLEYLSVVMKRSTPYRSFILAEADRLGAPDFLLYLPVIESSFSERAVSNAGASGIWQFMANSVAGYNIHIDDWRDERRDPWISTTAALRKLIYNFNYLGDWYLALAAYNSGLAAVTGAIKRSGISDYWELSERGYLYRETVNYVPKFLAIAEILSQSKELGIDWGEETPASELDVIMVNKSVDLNVLAKESGETFDLLKSLNPSLRYSITPPDKEYALRIPTAKKELIVEILNSGKPLIEYYVYKIRSGDTLYALSRHYGVSIDLIREWNPGIRPEALRIGSNILIPRLNNVEEFRNKKGNADTQFTGTYLVKKGDSLWSIAREYNIKMETLAEKNGIDLNAILRLGKVLKVPAF